MNVAKLGIIGAMREEVELFKDAIEDKREGIVAGITFVEGKWLGQQVVVCQSGVGKVNGAVCTQLLIDRFQTDAVVFTGVAGAVDPSLNIGDVVISSECMQHDMDVTALGYEKGIIPFTDVSIFTADPRLVELAHGASRQLFEGRTMIGRVLSGDQFIADRDKVKLLYTEMLGACTEMEGAAVAQVCTMNMVPFVIVRSMSDKADGSAHMNFAEFTELASKHSFQLIEQMIRELRA